MENFVSVFDRAFLPQFLAWRLSVQRHYANSRLWAFCVDSAAAEALRHLDLADVEVIDWLSNETDEYRNLRSTRSRAEYCWTLTPRSVLSVMEAMPDVHRVTYVDADMWLVAHPGPIFAEFESSRSTVVLSEHGFSPAADKGLQNGRYCVQFMPFRKAGNVAILQDWERDCIASCSADASSGNFGDQKYLDEWALRYGQDVSILGRRQLLLAPWNMLRFPVSEAVAFHFHGLRLLPGRGVYLGDYEIPRWIYESVYAPYLDDLAVAEEMLAEIGMSRVAQASRPSAFALWKLRRWRRRRHRPVPNLHR